VRRAYSDCASRPRAVTLDGAIPISFGHQALLRAGILKLATLLRHRHCERANIAQHTNSWLAKAPKLCRNCKPRRLSSFGPHGKSLPTSRTRLRVHTPPLRLSLPISIAQQIRRVRTPRALAAPGPIATLLALGGQVPLRSLVLKLWKGRVTSVRASISSCLSSSCPAILAPRITSCFPSSECEGTSRYSNFPS
jgi:hypothetical protein